MHEFLHLMDKSFKKRLAYTIDQVETFFRDDLKSDDVLLLLDRIDYLEMQLTQLYTTSIWRWLNSLAQYLTLK